MRLALWPIVLAIGAVVAAGSSWACGYALRGEGDTLTGRIIEWVGTWQDKLGGIVDWFRELPARTLGRYPTGGGSIKTWFAGRLTSGSVLSRRLNRHGI